MGTAGCDQVMQVCHATISRDKQGGGRAFGKKGLSTVREVYVPFLCAPLLRAGYIYPYEATCFLTYTTRISRDILAMCMCCRVAGVLQGECIHNCQAALGSTDDLYVRGQCSSLGILTAFPYG